MLQPKDLPKEIEHHRHAHTIATPVRLTSRVAQLPASALEGVMCAVSTRAVTQQMLRSLIDVSVLDLNRRLFVRLRYTANRRKVPPAYAYTWFSGRASHVDHAARYCI
jgi:hypothetical protein